MRTYCAYFQVGQKVRSLKHVEFTGEDISPHKEGEILEVTEDTTAYFNVMHEDYELVKEDQ
jgi:hypothetical protein